jgi:NAD(P)-dependent dehydrogenase (short-subunit alcohol dehydrogenase family)
MSTPDKTVLVTGASTGIGHACTKTLSQNGWHVFAGVRKTEDSERLVEEFGASVTPVIIDVTKPDTIASAAQIVRESLKGETLKGLVNNAGIAVAGPLFNIPVEDFENQMNVNVTGVLRVTQAFGPMLGADDSLSGEPGRIVMMSSVAGEMGAPFLGPYSASKHAVDGMSKSLRRELMIYGIEVIVIGPGAVATPIWAKAEKIDPEPYRETVFYSALIKIRDYMTKTGPAGDPPSKVADRVYRSLTDDKPRFRYAIVKGRFMNWSLPRLLPERMVNSMVAKRLGLRPEDR